MSEAGMVNVGQLVRRAHADAGVVAVGFGRHRGSVIASGRWGGRARSMDVPPAPEGSTEALLHGALEGVSSALFVFGDRQPEWSTVPRGHRAIGVVYDVTADRVANYVPTVLDRRYDAFVWLDETRALEPRQSARSGSGETWPSGG